MCTFATIVSTSLYTFERPKVKSTVYYSNIDGTFCQSIFPLIFLFFAISSEFVTSKSCHASITIPALKARFVLSSREEVAFPTVDELAPYDLLAGALFFLILSATFATTP